MNSVVTKILKSKTQIEAIKPTEKKKILFLILKDSPVSSIPNFSEGSQGCIVHLPVKIWKRSWLSVYTHGKLKINILKFKMPLTIGMS